MRHINLTPIITPRVVVASAIGHRKNPSVSMIREARLDNPNITNGTLFRYVRRAVPTTALKVIGMLKARDVSQSEIKEAVSKSARFEVRRLYGDINPFITSKETHPLIEEGQLMALTPKELIYLYNSESRRAPLEESPNIERILVEFVSRSEKGNLRFSAEDVHMLIESFPHRIYYPSLLALAAHSERISREDLFFLSLCRYFGLREVANIGETKLKDRLVSYEKDQQYRSNAVLRILRTFHSDYIYESFLSSLLCPESETRNNLLIDFGITITEVMRAVVKNPDINLKITAIESGLLPKEVILKVIRGKYPLVTTSKLTDFSRSEKNVMRKAIKAALNQGATKDQIARAAAEGPYAEAKYFVIASRWISSRTLETLICDDTDVGITSTLIHYINGTMLDTSPLL